MPVLRATILIVDDSKIMRGLVRGALEADRYRVVEAADGKEALIVIDGANPDLVITDVNMPEMDGLTLIRELRQLPAYLPIPILVLTTEAGDDLKKRGRAVGATGWLVKPFDPARLRETAECALRLREKALRKREGPGT
jgi:two-component system chemotaxis response regulator CheY